MDTSLELRLIEKGFDPSTSVNLTLEEAAQRIIHSYEHDQREGVTFFDGKGSIATVSSPVILMHVDGGPIFFDNGENEDSKYLQIYSADQLLNGRTPVHIQKGHGLMIPEKDELPGVLLSIDKAALITITPEAETSAGYFAAIPDGVPRDKVLWRAIAGVFG